MLLASARPRVVACLAVGALACAPAGAAAATKHGVTPLSPTADGHVAVGKAATFRMRVKGAGKVFVHVCKSAKKSKRDGTICSKATIGEAKGHGGSFTYKQKYYAFPAYWLSKPGTFYWQAYRIHCEAGSTADCRQEGPVVRFRVR